MNKPSPITPAPVATLRLGDAFQARATHEPSLASRLGLTVGIAIALAGCEAGPAVVPWYSQPSDPQVYALVLERCLNSTRGPASTRYNDWDEAIEACSSAALTASRYCPDGETCGGGQVSRADVRAILPKRAAQ